MFAGINMFWARLGLILARAARRGPKIMEDMKLRQEASTNVEINSTIAKLTV